MSLNETAKSKLTELTDRLETEVMPQPERFNMRTWNDPGFCKNECGSAGCAFAWAAVFWPDELKLTEMGVLHIPTGRFNFRGAAAMFGIASDSAYYLFSYGGKTDDELTLDAVISRIRDFVANDGYRDIGQTLWMDPEHKWREFGRRKKRSRFR